MAAVCFKFTTAASTNLQPVKAGQSANLKGYSIANAAAVSAVKLFWTNTIPTVGTTVPNATFNFAASVNEKQSFPDGITGNGELWVAVTAAPADSDNANATAGAVVTLFVE